MKQKAMNQTSTLRENVRSATRVHYFYVAAFLASIIAYDAFKLITHEALRQRWTLASVMLIATTLAWFAGRQNSNNRWYYSSIIYGLIAVDIIVAAVSVYAQRDMASRAVMLFVIPVALAAILKSRSALLATAALSATAYALAAVRYFADYPSEGYKIELYGELAFYSGLLFLLAALLWIVVRSTQKQR